MSEEDKKVRISNYISADLLEKIDQLAAKEDRSRNWMIRNLLEAGIDAKNAAAE